MHSNLRAIRLLAFLMACVAWLGLTATAVAPSSPADLVQEFDEYLAYEYAKTLATHFDGRRAGTLGGQWAAQFVAAAFQLLGLQPAGDNGTYFQNFEMPFLELAETPELVLLDEAGQTVKDFQHRVDFREFIFGNAGPGQAEAEVVYVGSGSRDELSSIPIAGKIILVVPRRGTNINIPAVVTEAMNQGAVGALIEANVAAALFSWEGSIPTIHRPDDTIDKIDPAKLRETGMLVALTALNLAGVEP